MRNLTAVGTRYFLADCAVCTADFQPDKQPPVAPSALRIQNGQAFTYEGPKDFSMPRELTTAEIKELVNDFAVSAKNAIEAGEQPFHRTLPNPVFKQSACAMRLCPRWSHHHATCSGLSVQILQLWQCALIRHIHHPVSLGMACRMICLQTPPELQVHRVTCMVS